MDPASMTRSEVTRALASYPLAGFRWTLLLSTLSVPAGLRLVPPQHRFTPLLVMGTIGGLIDFGEDVHIFSPLRRRLEELDKGE